MAAKKTEDFKRPVSLKVAETLVFNVSLLESGK